MRPEFFCQVEYELIVGCAHVHFAAFNTEGGTVVVPARVPIHSAGGAELARGVAEVCPVVFTTGPAGVEHCRAGVGKVSPLLAFQVANRFAFALDNIELPLAYCEAFRYGVICGFRVMERENSMRKSLVRGAAVGGSYPPCGGDGVSCQSADVLDLSGRPGYRCQW